MFANKNRKIILFWGIIIFLFLTRADFIFALEATYPTIMGMQITDSSSFPEYAKYFFNIGMAIAGLLAVIVIIFGGIYYLISLGRGKFTDEGKQWIKAGILGLLLTVSSYLIAYTINPDLVIFKLDKLPIIGGIFNSQPTTPTGPPFLTYNEIPIGTLTENLLSRTMDCYNFDENGDPIESEEIETDNYGEINGPTYLERDRVDCLLKLSQAAEKKAKIITDLSDKIINLMELCSCSGTFTFTGSTTTIGNGSPSVFFSASDCKSNCAKNGKDCLYPEGGTCPRDEDDIGTTSPCKDACSKSAGCSCQGQNCQTCPADAKEKIEHGPIQISDCIGNIKEYKGLEEFRTQFSNNYEFIKNTVEIQPPPKVNGKETTIIKKDSWQELRLIDQLTYLKGKMEKIKSKVKQDLNQLQDAESSLEKCYIADTYIDFLKTYEQTSKKDKIVLIQKTFSDPDTNQLINPAKYCEGFQYNNSSCYSQCQKVCPGTEQEDFDCYKSGEISEVKECFDNRVCIPGASPFNTFEECFTNCKQQCLDSCNAMCPGEDKNKCQEKCRSNSQCLLDNEEKCLMDFNQLKECADTSDDPDFLKNCANNATLCKYCSDQYAGYPECLNSPYSLRDEYSSSFIYQNPSYQICAEPYKIFTINSNGDKSTCLNLYPETAKCPASSKCPECPCDIIKETINYSSGESDSETGISKKTNEYRVCSGDCENFAYNDDPLTFYCQQSWWLLKDETKDIKPIGNEKICPKEREIPVGKTVDDAEKWAQDFIDNIDKLTKKVQNMIDYINDIAEETNYCQCDSKCDDAGQEPTCRAKCVFQQTEATTITTALGDGTEYDTDVPEECSCVRERCDGNPCQKMINLLRGKTSNGDCPKGVEYKGIAYYHNQIDNGIKDFVIFTIQQNRSDVLKELSYSRKKINECSVIQNNYGTQTRILSCTRVEDEILSPIIDKNNKTIVGDRAISSYCYGKALGEVLKTSDPMADNWFCCEDRKKE